MFDPRSFFSSRSFGDVLEISPMTMGMSSAAVYSVTTTLGNYVLRVHRRDAASWAQNNAMQSAAAAIGIAPAILALDETHQATLSPKIFDVPQTSRIDVLKSLVNNLYRLHGIPNPTKATVDPVA